MKNIYKTLVSVIVSAGLSLPALGDDTELFNVNPDLLAINSAPNVLLILDNSANWDAASQHWPDNGGKQGAAEIAALKNIIAGLPTTANINLGLMMFVKSSSNPAGGYVRFAIRPMNANNRNAFVDVLGSLDISADKVASADTDYSAALFEAFKYFGAYGTYTNGVSTAGATNDATHFGPIPRAGTQGDDGKRDFNGNTTVGSAFKSGQTLALSPALSGFALANNGASTPYTGPNFSTTTSCAGNYIIFIGNGYPSKDDGSTLLGNVTGDTAQLPLPSTPPKANSADEWARFLYSKADVSSTDGQQRVVTYAIDVYKDAQDMNETNLLKSMASGRAGHGRYFAATNQDEIALALNTVFNEIQSVNSVFAAATLPVSVNVRGTNLNQVYIGVFRPDSDGLPRWFGNLKEYKLAVDASQSLFLTDSRSGTPQPAVNPTTGQFNPDAISYWTTPNPGPAADANAGFWSFSPSGSPISGYDSPDGAIVEKGGAAQMLRLTYPTTTEQANRNVLTCLGCTSTLTKFDNFNITGATQQSKFNAADATELTDIVNWIRGQDNLNENQFSIPINSSTTDVRASIHGDIMHSRPAVVNFNRFANSDDDVVIFYGSNDGLLRAVKGGTAATGGIAAGSELWAFMPQEFFGSIKRLRDNFPPTTNLSGLTQHAVTTSGLLTTPRALTFSTPQAFTSLSTGMTVTGSNIAPKTFVTGLSLDTSSPPNISGVTLSQDIMGAVSASITFTPNPKPYFADGAIGVLTSDADLDGRLCATSGVGACPTNGDKVQIFVSMRRGGRWIYALDVSNPTTPKFMWKKGCDSSGCSAGYDELGQTWSNPAVAKINLSGVATDVLIFGAGYDPAVEDLDPIPTGTTSTMGRGIFVVRASDGSVVWQAGPGPTVANYLNVPGMTYSIPSDLALIDRNNDGNIDRIYVGDMGGNIWRANIGDPSPANWTVFKLASVGFAASGAGTNVDSANPAKTQRRKFYYPPDVVAAKDSIGNYDAVLIGAGDREHPFNGYGKVRVAIGAPDDPAHLAADTVLNRYYMFKDRDTGVALNGTNIGGSSSGTIGETQLADDTASDNSNTLISSVTPRGWFRTLDAGEKVVGGSVTLGGVTFFNTNVPTPPGPNQCGSNLGEAREYAVNSLTGGAGVDRNGDKTISYGGVDLYNAISGGGYLPSPIAVFAKIDGKIYPGVASGGNLQTAPSVTFGKKVRTYWHKKLDQ